MHIYICQLELKAQEYVFFIMVNNTLLKQVNEGIKGSSIFLYMPLLSENKSRFCCKLPFM